MNKLSRINFDAASEAGGAVSFTEEDLLALIRTAGERERKLIFVFAQALCAKEVAIA